MKTYSELRDHLIESGVNADEADRIAKGAVKSGKCTDDTIDGTIMLKDLIDAAEGLRALREPEETVSAAENIAKSGNALEEDVADLLRAACFNTEAINDFQRDALPAIAKGVHAHGVVLEQMVGVLNDLSARVTSMGEELGKPAAPRGVRPGTTIQQHPSDIAKGAKVVNIDRKRLTAALRQQHRDFIAKGGQDNEDQIGRLGKAIGMLENTSVPIDNVLKQFDIEVGE